MYVLYCLLHVNLEIRCKITKNVLYTQQFWVKNVLRAQQICAKKCFAYTTIICKTE